MTHLPKLDAATRECAVHAQTLLEARNELAPAMPLDAARVQALPPELRRLLDQAAYRFMKLQDALGERVLPLTLEAVDEPLPPSATFAEKLQRLERLQVIPAAARWRELREIRNQIAHEYPDAPALRAAALNRFVAGIGELLAIWSGVAAFLTEKRLVEGT